MKIIVTENQITALENVRKVKFRTTGSGTKSNPYSYVIVVFYTNDDKVFINFNDKKKEADEAFLKIAEILQKEN